MSLPIALGVIAGLSLSLASTVLRAEDAPASTEAPAGSPPATGADPGDEAPATTPLPLLRLTPGTAPQGSRRPALPVRRRCQSEATS